MDRRYTQSLLKYFAELAPAGKKVTDVVNRTSEFAWLGGEPPQPRGGEAPFHAKTDELRRLASIASLHAPESLLRIGWLFVTGTLNVDGKTARYCLPLLSAPIRLVNRGLAYQLVYDGGFEMENDHFDWDARLELEDSTAPFQDVSQSGDGPLAEWVHAALSRAGLPMAMLRRGDTNPLDHRDDPGLNVVVGAGVYSSRDVATPDMTGVLTTWSHQPVAESALGSLYGIGEKPARQTDSREIRSPLPLNATQREALDRLRRESVVVVSGPPGTGKSHLVAAAAIDAVARGHSVLIATQSDYAVSVVADLLQKHPGPRFVRFGSRDARENVAAELADGLAQPLAAAEHRDLEAAAAGARKRLDRMLKTIEASLHRELEFAEGLRSRDLNLLSAAQTPGVLDVDFDLRQAERLVEGTRGNAPILGSWFRARAVRKLRALLRCDGQTTLDEMEAGLEAARAERAVQRGLAGGGLSLAAAWEDLEAFEKAYRGAVGRAIEAQRRARENGKRRSTRAVATLASALRAGRARRRQILRELEAGDFLDVLPMWIGTLQEIDDTLPVVPAAFDLVIFDEASQIDQIRAAPALARGKRAMVVGDPRQLRHVSFVSDDAMREAADRQGMGPRWARLLDVRRNSLFDAGAAASNITWLDEHFRSVPHVIAFSDRTFYGGRLRLMTQHPRNETRDAIHTVRVDGIRDDDGVNRVEVEEVLRQIEAYAATGAQSIGVITPFRPQADALEDAILAAYGPEDVERLGLRAGTVHSFQGNERDVVIASLTIAGDPARGSLNFLQNPNLFNVLVTRARREMVVVTSVDESALPGGLLADYLRHAEHAPHGADGGAPATKWTEDVMRELKAFGIPVVPSYPVAGWSVDLAMGEQEGTIGVETSIHPAGVEAHIEQHLALRRAGWDMADAFQSRWLTDAAGAAQMLSKLLLRKPGNAE